MIRILPFFIPTKNLNKMFKAPTLPPVKKSPAITRTFDLSLEKYGTVTVLKPATKFSFSFKFKMYACKISYI